MVLMHPVRAVLVFLLVFAFVCFLFFYSKAGCTEEFIATLIKPFKDENILRTLLKTNFGGKGDEKEEKRGRWRQNKHKKG